MKFTLKLKKDYEIGYLKVSAEVRYWEDAELNGKDCPESGEGFPKKNGDYWEPIINVETGIIDGWPKGVTAKTHFKVCDMCSVKVLDAGLTELLDHDGYVPDILCPGGAGYGDYMIMSITEEGKIENWNPKDLYEMFEDEDEDY